MNRANKILLLILMFLCFIFNASRNIYAEVYGSISGKVINVDTGEPVKGIGVSIDVLDPKLCKPLSCGYDSYKKTDDNGNYVFKKVPPGEYKISLNDFTTEYRHYYYDTSMGKLASLYTSIDCEKYRLFMGKKSVNDYVYKYQGNYELPINLQAGENITGLDIKIKKVYGTISGKIMHQDGTPYGKKEAFIGGNAIIDNITYGWARPGELTDENGNFVLNHLEDSNNWNLIIYYNYRGEDHPFMAQYKYPHTVDTRGAKDVKSIMIYPIFDTTTGFFATIFDTTHTALKDIDITLIHKNNLGYIDNTIANQSDEYGRVSFKGILPGIYNIVLRKLVMIEVEIKRRGTKTGKKEMEPGFKVYEYPEIIEITPNNIKQKELIFIEDKAIAESILRLGFNEKCNSPMFIREGDLEICNIICEERKRVESCISNVNCLENPAMDPADSCGEPNIPCDGVTVCTFPFTNGPPIPRINCPKNSEFYPIVEVHENKHVGQIGNCSNYTTIDRYNAMIIANRCNWEKAAYASENSIWDNLRNKCRSEIGLGSDWCDEQFAVNDPIIPEPLYYSQIPDVAILDNGASLQMQSLISNFKYGSILTDINTTPQDLLNFSRVLVCPTGSLVGNDSSPQFKALLEQYVSAGGFLVVMSTQHSSDLQCIPVPEGEVLSGYMWREDMSCWSNSCEIQDWHNILSGQSQATISEPVDGFFTEWPGNAKVLLRRSKNGQPCMILYPYGKGYVLATTIYTDYATSVGQASQSGKNLIRDIIAFSKYPVEMSEYRPGASISLPITITNKTDKESVSASVSVLTPDGEIKEVRSQNSEGRIEPWKSITTNYTGTAGNELGIWRIIYALLDSSGIEIQKESSAGNFVVSDPPAVIQPSPDLSFSVQSDAENYAIGSNPVFTVITWNRSNEERNITCKYFFPHHFWTTRDYQYGGDWWKPELQLTKTMIIPPNSSTSFMHTLNNVSTLDRLWAYFYDENGNKVGEASRAINVYQPNIQAGVNTDKSFYGVNETVNVNITLNNMQNISFPSTAILKVLDPKNAKIYEKSFACNFISNAVLNLNDTYTLPAVSEFGYYIAIVEVNDTEGKIIGNASIYFEHLRCQTKTTPNLPSSFIFGTNNISFNLSNTGKVNTSNGNLSVSLKDPDGSEIFLENKSFSLITGGNMALDFDVPIPLFKSGNYILSYIQSDETNTGEIYKIQIPSSIATNLSFDKPFYKIRDTANLSLSLKNIGKFNMGNVEVKLQVPDAGYIDTKNITLSADTEIILNYTSVIPETMLNGNHNIEVQLTSSGNTLTQNFIFTIPESNINIVGLANTTYSSGNNIGLNIENTGGVDTDVNYIIELYDLRNFKFANVTGTTAVKSDSTILLELPIPNSARTGKYYVHASCLDVKTNKSSYFIKETEVIGNSISLAVETDKDIYFSNESINATTSFTANSGQILNGNLNVKVLATVPEQIIKKYTWWNPDWYYRIPIKIESGNYERKDSPIEMNISFTEILNNIGKTGTFDENSIRIIEYDSIGNIIKEIPYQFNKVTDYNAVINAGIEAVWIMDGITPIGVTRHYVLYFDILENGAKEIPDYGVISAVLDNTNKYFKTSGVRIKWGGNGCLGYGADIITDFRFDDNNNNNPDDDLDRIQNEEWNHVYYFSLVMLKLEIEMKNL